MNKILRLTFALAMALICGTSLAQTTVTFDATKDKGADGGTAAAKEVSVAKDGITIKASQESNNGGAFGNGQQYRIYQNSTLTFTSTVGNITKVVITSTASGTSKYGPGNLASPSTGKYEVDGTKGTWTGDAASFTLTASAQVRATKIEVTYKSTGVSKKDAGLAWSESSISLEKGSAFTAPTFTKATTASVTFKSDNEDVASVNSEGMITLGTANGKANITATAEENDEYNAGSATCTIEIYNNRVYKKASTVESGKKYLIVAKRDGKTYYAYPLGSDKKYGYISTGSVDGDADELKVKDTYDDSFEFTTQGNGFSIKDSYGRYLIQQGTYKSFNLSDEPEEWTVEAQTDGTFKISMNGYYMQFGQGTYTSFGVYTEAQENAVMPYLYSLDDSATGINAVKSATNTVDAPVYNLAGQRVSNSYKGVVIQNGRKFIQK